MVDIVFQAHHSVISDNMRARAERIVHKIAARLPRATGARVRFEEDGPHKRVEIEILTPGRKIVADSRGPFLGAALADAGNRLLTRVQRDRRDKNKKHVMRSRRLNGELPDDFSDDDGTSPLTA